MTHLEKFGRDKKIQSILCRVASTTKKLGAAQARHTAHMASMWTYSKERERERHRERVVQFVG
jgi:uncharacterized phage-associated protein